MPSQEKKDYPRIIFTPFVFFGDLTSLHEYTGEALSLRYQDCISCHRRTEFTCVKCSYCYSCHWKREQIEQVELRDKLKDFYLLSSKVKQEPKLQTEDTVTDKELGKWGTLDVLGQPAEPICNYYGMSSQVFTPRFKTLQV